MQPFSMLATVTPKTPTRGAERILPLSGDLLQNRTLEPGDWTAEICLLQPELDERGKLKYDPTGNVLKEWRLASETFHIFDRPDEDGHIHGVCILVDVEMIKCIRC